MGLDVNGKIESLDKRQIILLIIATRSEVSLGVKNDSKVGKSEFFVRLSAVYR